MIGTPPYKRTGYYYLPSGWRNKALPVMVLLHGLEGYGISILNSGSIGTFQVHHPFFVSGPVPRSSINTAY